MVHHRSFEAVDWSIIQFKVGYWSIIQFSFCCSKGKEGFVIQEKVVCCCRYSYITTVALIITEFKGEKRKEWEEVNSTGGLILCANYIFRLLPLSLWGWKRKLRIRFVLLKLSTEVLFSLKLITEVLSSLKLVTEVLFSLSWLLKYYSVLVGYWSIIQCFFLLFEG